LLLYLLPDFSPWAAAHFCSVITKDFLEVLRGSHLDRQGNIVAVVSFDMHLLVVWTVDVVRKRKRSVACQRKSEALWIHRVASDTLRSKTFISRRLSSGYFILKSRFMLIDSSSSLLSMFAHSFQLIFPILYDFDFLTVCGE
jgi:hypothetical protein